MRWWSQVPVVRKQSISGDINSRPAGATRGLAAWSCVTLLGCLIGACGEPVVATVGLVSGDSHPDTDGGRSEGDGDAEGSPVNPLKDAGGERDGALDREEDASIIGDCLTLPDQSVIVAPPGSGDLIVGTTVKEALCTVDESTGQEDSSIWSRKDGVPLMEAGESYSFRWPEQIYFLKALRLFGGSEQCSTGQIHDWTATLPNYLPSPGCADIRATFDVTYLRMAEEYSQWDMASGYMVPMQLCKTPCPPEP